jgi:phosphonate transport system substrate-binding protein
MGLKTINKICRSLALGLALPAAACSPDNGPAPPSVLNIAVLPDEQEAALRQRYAPLVAHLGKQLSMEVRLTVPDDYGHLVELFGSGELDMAYFGGVTFLNARARYGAVPLVMRDIDAAFSSYFLARADRPESALEQFAGRSFAFGSELSTSGHLMPRRFLQERGLTPEDFFASVGYSGAHDTTVAWVRDGTAALGAANSQVVEAMLRDGRLQPGVLRILLETPPYADYVWAIRPGLPEDFVNRVRDAFLGLSMIDPEDLEVLHRMGTEGFLPASSGDFDSLREVMSGLPRFHDLTAARPE